MKFNSQFLILTVVLACAIAVYADTYNPVPAQYLGISKSIQVNGNVGYAAGPNGGQFMGTIGGFSTYFWCVDDQLFFQPGQSGLANVTRLSDVSTYANEVRYGDVTNDAAGTPHWTNIIANGSNLPSSAQERYQMAAYLISQYHGFDSTILPEQRSDAIQQAIWAITNNDSPFIQNGGYKTISALPGDENTTGYWVDEARLHYGSVDMSRWAVVSWGVDKNGTLGTAGYGSEDGARQTFLVEAVPDGGITLMFLGGALVGLETLRRKVLV